MTINIYWYLFSLSDLMKLEISRQILKILIYQVLSKSVRRDPILSARTDRPDEANSCFSQFCERDYKESCIMELVMK